MSTPGTVRFWLDGEGWGIVDSAETPGGCWTHFSHLAMRGFRSLEAGRRVEIEWEAAQQDGFSYRAVRVWPEGQQPHDPYVAGGPDAYSSTLTITFDEE